MNDIFISYARKDQEFVRELYEMLKTAKRDPWVDWEGIPPSARWLQEVYDAIEAADTFVFVLSPESLGSHVCMQEVAHAQQFKKRIIPVVCANVAGDQAPPVLRELNWIFFRASDNREEAFRKLEFALDTDLGFWKLSASLLVRSRQWEAGKKDRSLVLRGKELTEAEQWLAKGVDIQPAPTPLQTQFITASRRATTRRQRTTTGVLAASTSIFLILSIVSLLLFQNANTQQHIATQQRNTAIARQLALESGVALNQDTPDLALLLGAEATKMDSNVQTRDALLDALVDNPHLTGMYHAPGGLVTNVAVSPDGMKLYGIGSALYAWDMAEPAHAPKTLALPSDLTGSRPASISSVLVSHDGTLLAILAPQRLSLVDAATGAILQKIELDNLDYEFAVAFSQNDTQVEVAYTYEFDLNGPNDQTRIQVRQYDTKSGKQLGSPFDIPYTANQPFLFSHDASLIAVGGCPANALHCANGQVNVWNVSQRHLIATFSVGPGGMTTMAFSDDDSLLAVGTCALDSVTNAFRCNHGDIEIWSVATHTLKYSALVRNELGEVFGLTFSSDSNYLLSSLMFGACSGDNCNQGQMQLWAVNGLQMIGEPFVGHLSTIGGMVFLPDGEHVLTPGGAGGVYEWTIGVYDAISSYIVLPYEQGAFGDSRPVYSASGTNLIMRNGLNIYTWNPFTGATLSKVPIQGPGYVTLSADGQMAAECESDTLLWDVTGHQLLRRLSDTQDIAPCQRAAFSTDGKYLAGVFLDFNTGHSNIVIWDVASGVMLQRISTAPALDIEVAFSADSSKIATLSDRTTLMLWSRATGAAQMKPIKVGKSLGTLPQNLHGNEVTLHDDDGRTSTFDTYMLKALLTQPSSVSGGVSGLVAFTPDGRYLATFGYYSLTIWDIAQKAPYVHFPHTGPDNFGATFSRDGRYLSWDDGDGIIITRSLNVSDWQRAACAVASRNLTKAEWTQYVGSVPYAKVCPDLNS
ncbi:MAG TPA: TIR domain-containing protein [Ktedonobacterales bacterium]|jgi:WD40 repeat protein